MYFQKSYSRVPIIVCNICEARYLVVWFTRLLGTYLPYLVEDLEEPSWGCFEVAVIRENNERIMFSKDSNYEKEKPIKLKEQVHNKTMLNVTC